MRNLKRRLSLSNYSAFPIISLTPLIDTVLVLLIIFMVTTPSQKGVFKDPDAVSALLNKVKLDKKDCRVVFFKVDKSCNCFINDKFVEQKDLLDKLNSEIKNSPIRTIFVRLNPLSDSEFVSKLFVKLRSIKGARILFG